MYINLPLLCTLICSFAQVLFFIKYNHDFMFISNSCWKWAVFAAFFNDRIDAAQNGSSADS